MSREIIEPAIRNLIDLNGWMVKWEPKKLARMIDIPVKKLYNAGETEWFIENESWIPYLLYYRTKDNKSRIVYHRDTILVHPSLYINFDVIYSVLYSGGDKKYKEFESHTLIPKYWSYHDARGTKIHRR